jgi:DnaJ family protein C protein 8
LQSNSFNQDQEVERILALAAKASNPIEVLNLDPKVWLTPNSLDPKDVKVTYRKKSLLLHPDKCKHPKAQDAFEMLKKAESELMDEGKRTYIMGLIQEARVAAYKKKGYLRSTGTTLVPAAGVTIPTMEKDPDGARELVSAIKLETRRLMMDQGQRDSVRLKNEVERKANEEKVVAEERKRKQEFDKQWEDVCRFPVLATEQSKLTMPFSLFSGYLSLLPILHGHSE